MRSESQLAWIHRDRLKRLHLQITTEQDESNPEDDIYFNAMHDFF